MEGNSMEQLSKMDKFELKKNAGDIVLRRLEHEEKFEYAIIALVFGTTALSFQFSSSLGIYHLLILIYSWVLYLIAAAISGYKVYLMKNCIYDFSEFVKGNTLNTTDDSELMPELIYLDQGKRKKKKVDALLAPQIWFYSLALLFNFLFISMNLLLKIGIPKTKIWIDISVLFTGIVFTSIGFFKFKGINKNIS